MVMVVRDRGRGRAEVMRHRLVAMRRGILEYRQALCRGRINWCKVAGEKKRDL